MGSSQKCFSLKGRNVMLGLSDIDVGWVVGFLEGEGTFQLRTPGAGGKYGYPSIRAFQVQKWPIEKLHRLLGGTMHLRDSPSRSVRAQPCWTWYRDGRDVTEILIALQPLFSPRRQNQIQRILDGTKRGAPPKLSYEIAQAIRASDEHRSVLADRYGVTSNTISFVRSGKIWKSPPQTTFATNHGNARPGRGPSTGARSRSA